MRLKTLSWLAVVSIAVLGVAQSVAAPKQSDEDAIRAQTTQWVEAYNGGDAAAVTALYAEDALLLPPGSPGARGREAILAFFKKDIAASKEAGVVMHADPDTEVGISGDMGWESGTYKATIGDEVVDTGKFMSVSIKVKGKWLYLRDTWNSDQPATPAEPSEDEN